MRLGILISLILICFSIDGKTQDNTNTGVDTVSTFTPKDEGAFKKLFKGEPGKSAMWGMVIPGGGQFYNRKYFSGVVAAGADIGVLIYAINRHQNYNYLNRGYLGLLREEIEVFDQFNSASQIKPFRDRARKQKEYAYLYAGITHVATALWAFMQAHLIDFDASEDLSVNLEFDSSMTNIGLASHPVLSVSIPLSRLY